jgi:DNA-binding XRE family transcriptional regulator
MRTVLWAGGEPLHKVLRQARIDQEITQVELAAKMGVHRSTVQHLENGQKTPRLPTLVAWITCLSLEMTVNIREDR